MNFKDLKLNPKLIQALDEIGFIEMSPIQNESIPFALEGFDIIGQAQTGTGKTAAFGVPILEKTNTDSNDIQHLIIAPTRELSLQIQNQLKKMNKYLEAKISLIVGGISYEKQIKEITEKPQIIVGTPGRIVDYLKNKRLKFNNLKSFTLDEADELLNMGFKEDIEFIISHLPKERQSFFFTATFDEKIKKLAQITVKSNYKNINISSGLKTNSNIKQEFILVKEKNKFETLIKLLNFHKPQSVVIFGRTKKRVDELNEALKKSGFDSIGIHGDIQQRERNLIMNNFRSKKAQILVATDVVARGIDINHIEWIINFDLPQEIEYYTHRIGRVGRNGNLGYSISFVKQDEIEHLKEIEFKTKSKIKEIQLPTEEEIYRKWRLNINDKFKNILDSYDETGPTHLEDELIKDFSEKEMAIIIAHFLLKDKHKYKKINLTPEPSVVLKGRTKIRNIKKQINRFNSNKQDKKNKKVNSKKRK